MTIINSFIVVDGKGPAAVMAGTRYLTWNEAAAILGVSQSTVHRMIRRGDIGRAAPLKTAQLSLRMWSGSPHAGQRGGRTGTS